jgi:hypothetical protein
LRRKFTYHFAAFGDDWNETQLSTVNSPEILAVLITVEETANCQLRELACAVHVSEDEGVGEISVGLSIDWKRSLARRRGGIEKGEDVVAIVGLVLGSVRVM